MDGQIDRANVLCDQGKFEEARMIYENCIKKYGEQFIIIANLAFLEMDCNQFDKAIEMYERALKMDQKWFDGWYNLGNLYADKGPEFEARACECYQTAITINDSDADVYNNLALCLMKSGQLQLAVEYEKKAFRLDSTNPNILLNLAELYNQLGENKKALFFAERAAAASKSVNAFLLLASILINENETKRALDILKQIVDTSSSLQLTVVTRYYTLLMRNGHTTDAHNLLKKLRTEYAKQYSEDLIGLQTLQLMIGEPCTTRSSLEALYKQQTTLSPLCESLILHLSVENAKELAHKCIMADYIRNAGVLSENYPNTFVVTSNQDILTIVGTMPRDVTWYLKDPSVQRGQGITIFKAEEAQSKVGKLDGKRMCLQQAIEPLLLNDTKFGIRMHVFVRIHNKTIHVYMCQDGILTMCATAYSNDDLSLQAQITCTSVQRSLPGFDRAAVKGPASIMWADFNDTLPKFETVVMETIQLVASKLGGEHFESSTGLRGQLFGYDFLVDIHDNPVFIEANISPQFQDSKHLKSLFPTVAQPLINGFFRILVSEDDTEQHWPGEWKKIGEIPILL